MIRSYEPRDFAAIAQALQALHALSPWAKRTEYAMVATEDKIGRASCRERVSDYV